MWNIRMEKKPFCFKIRPYLEFHSNEGCRSDWVLVMIPADPLSLPKY